MAFDPQLEDRLVVTGLKEFFVERRQNGWTFSSNSRTDSRGHPRGRLQVHANVRAATNHCNADIRHSVCYGHKPTANHGAAHASCNRLGANRSAADRHTNLSTADTHCVACHSYKPTASYDGATDGRSRS
jgi:hypothetical protein